MKIIQKMIAFWDRQKRAERETFGNDYWISYTHKNPFHHSPRYDGKWMTRGDFPELRRLESALTPYVRSGELEGFKFKNPDTPMASRFANELPPMFVYASLKDKEKVYNLLTSLGGDSNNLEWIEDDISPEARNIQIMILEEEIWRKRRAGITA